MKLLPDAEMINLTKSDDFCLSVCPFPDCRLLYRGLKLFSHYLIGNGSPCVCCFKLMNVSSFCSWKLFREASRQCTLILFWSSFNIGYFYNKVLLFPSLWGTLRKSFLSPHSECWSRQQGPVLTLKHETLGFWILFLIYIGQIEHCDVLTSDEADRNDFWQGILYYLLKYPILA